MEMKLKKQELCIVQGVNQDKENYKKLHRLSPLLETWAWPLCENNANFPANPMNVQIRDGKMK